MSFSIFLSHNHLDKPLVEPVAIRLSEIFGREQIFYDSWSIKPGDGIIDRMNSGLEAPDYVLFFVSRTSLASAMVRLEWQNALYAASKGKTRLIPIRVDGSEMPPLLRQSLYIDMYTVGLEVAIARIVSVAHGQASFTPQYGGFSNLTYENRTDADGNIEIAIAASHLMETHLTFHLITTNSKEEVRAGPMNGGMFLVDFENNIYTSATGTKANAIELDIRGITITPNYPLMLSMIRCKEKAITLLGIFHRKSMTEWVSVPIKKQI